MAFPTAYLADPVKTNPGEILSEEVAYVKGYTTFEDALTVGVFAKLDTGSIDNLDESATPVLAGVVLRDVANSVEAAATIDSDLSTIVNLIQKGPASVTVKSGETPAAFGRVYVSNATGSLGQATATSTDLPTNSVFLYEIKTGVWAIWVDVLGSAALEVEALVAAAAAVTAVAAADADGTYDADTATLINQCKTAINAILTALTPA